MYRMRYTNWQKLPSGGMWRRDPSSMRFIGLKGTNTINRSLLTLKMTPRTKEMDEVPLGTVKSSSVSLGKARLTSILLGSTKTTPNSFQTFDRPFGTIKTSSVSLGMIKMTSGSLGTVKTTSESLGMLNTPSGALETRKPTPVSLVTLKMMLATLEMTVSDKFCKRRELGDECQ
jgi:hypothetical protein